jgi:hypothetical protein
MIKRRRRVRPSNASEMESFCPMTMGWWMVTPLFIIAASRPERTIRIKRVIAERISGRDRFENFPIKGIRPAKIIGNATKSNIYLSPYFTLVINVKIIIINPPTHHAR